MPSGQQKGLDNLARVNAWIRERHAANDWGRYVAPSTGLLNRSELARDIGIGLSATKQNPAIKDLLVCLERELVQKGILTPNASGAAPDRQTERVADRCKQRLAQLEQQLANAQAENHALRAKLERYHLLDDFLMEHERLPL